MKKKVLTILMLFSVLFIVSACNVKPANVFEFVLNENSDEFLVMLTSADYPPFENIVEGDNGKNTVVGVDIEIGKAIARHAGKNLRVIHKDFDFLVSDIMNGRADFAIAGMTPTAERAAQVAFSQSYYDSEDEQVVIIREADSNKFQAIADINYSNIRVGAQAGSLQALLLSEQAPNATASLLPDLNNLLSALNNTNIDALFTEKSVAETHINGAYPNFKIAFEVESNYAGNAIAVTKGNDSLLVLINEVISQLRASGQIEEWFTYFSNLDEVVEHRIFTWNNVRMLLSGLLMTLIFALLAVAIGAVLALVPAFMRLSGSKIASQIATWYVEIIRGTPMLVQVFIFYELLPLPVMIFAGIDLGTFVPGLIAVVINCSAYISEIVRGGILAVDKGQSEAARSLGMSKNETMFKIVMPQAIKKIIPSLGNEFVTIIKETSIFMYLGIAELMFQINIIKSRTYRNLEVFLIAGLLYLLLTIPLSKLMNRLEKRLSYESK